MQTKSLRRVSCPTTRIIWNLPPAALEREKTHATNRLREAKCDLNPACNVLGVSRASTSVEQPTIGGGNVTDATVPAD